MTTLGLIAEALVFLALILPPVLDSFMEGRWERGSTRPLH